MRTWFQKIAGVFRDFGIAGGFVYLVDRALSLLSPACRLHFYELMVQPITGKPLLAGKFSTQLETRVIDDADPEIALMPVRPEVMAARLRQNATCIGAFKRGGLIGYMWFCRQTYEEDEVRCTYVLARPDHSVFDFDFFLFPEHRMGLGFVALWNGANEFLGKLGIRYTFSRLTRFNLASRRAHRHLGWKLVGRALFLQLGRLEFMTATVFPYIHVSVSQANRVRLRLKPDILADG